MAIKIRKARLKEVGEISKLQGLLMEGHRKFDEYWQARKGARKAFASYAKRMIHSPNAVLFVAEDNGKIVGYSLGKIEKRPPIFKIQKTGQITDAFVLKEYRRKGLAKRMVNRLIEWFKSKGIDIVELDVDNRNDIGMKVWKKMKFERYMIRKKRRI